MTIDDILDRANERAKQAQLPYRGVLTPTEAHTLLQHQPKAQLVDVRTRAELDWVGRVPGAVEVEWNSWPGSVPNPHFLTQLEQALPKDTMVLFLCRSGARSHNAAMLATQAGFTDCFNVLEGFEGDLDAHGQRGHVGGWRHAGLPWQQS
ncbi:rhodanese-like domain-containing protein [Uliginosibacterium gangwonense]|uniref:rhodanese-like domain-containing protein n=1 Tax=Uliginosibacterium gangwonense TaxID=392736 RepID=UPI000369B95D|nr:rhodanese-like domain-containing protein [Uliginosibacterium gangwonense]